MPKKQVAVEGFAFAQTHEVGRVQFLSRIQMNRNYVMRHHVVKTPADGTRRIVFEMVVPNRPPLGGSRHGESNNLLHRKGGYVFGEAEHFYYESEH